MLIEQSSDKFLELNLEGSLEINIVFCSTIGKWFKNVTSHVNVHYVNCFVAIKKEKGAL